MVSIAAFQAVVPGSIPGRRRNSFVKSYWTGEKYFGEKNEIFQKIISASTGNRTRNNSLEGCYANHYTIDALVMFAVRSTLSRRIYWYKSVKDVVFFRIYFSPIQYDY